MFNEIDMRRALAGIQQKELCERAGVHPTRYTARKNGRGGLSERSLKRLDDALRELVKERNDALDDIDAIRRAPLTCEETTGRTE